MIAEGAVIDTGGKRDILHTCLCSAIVICGGG